MDYLNFCMDFVVPIKTVRCFQNKPWITSNVKEILNSKKRNKEKLKRVQREHKVRLRAAKEEYRRKVERKLQNINMRELWDGMRTITGCTGML